MRRHEIVDDEDVGVLAERGARRGHCVVGGAADLTLADQRQARVVHQANLPLERNHVLGALPVDEIDERGDHRRLAAGARAGNEHDALRLGGEGLDFAGQAELFGGGRPAW